MSNRFLFRLCFGEDDCRPSSPDACSFASASTSSSLILRIEAIFAPRALACSQPPYVRGGSYGVAVLACHFLSAASRRWPCLIRRSRPCVSHTGERCVVCDRATFEPCRYICDGRETHVINWAAPFTAEAVSGKRTRHSPRDEDVQWRATHGWQLYPISTTS